MYFPNYLKNEESLAGYNAVHSGRNLTTHSRNLLPPSSTLKMEAVCFSETSVNLY